MTRTLLSLCRDMLMVKIPVSNMYPGHDSYDAVRALRRRMYLIALPLGIVVTGGFMLARESRGGSSMMDSAGALAAMLGMSLMLALLWKKPQFLTTGELLLYCVVALTLAGKFFELLYLDGETVGTAFHSLLIWVPVVYTMAFLMFEGRHRFVVSGLFFAAIALLGVGHMAQRFWTRTPDPDVALITMFLLANIIYIVLVFASSTLNAEFVRAYLTIEELNEVAQTDTVAAVTNRRQMELLLHRQWQIAAMTGRPFSVIMFDLDHFKQVNDRFGHARGEEFIVLTSDLYIEEAGKIAECLRHVLANHDFAEVGTVTASFGVTVSDARDSVGTLVERADAAMYRAKHNGRNRVEAL